MVWKMLSQSLGRFYTQSYKIDWNIIALLDYGQCGLIQNFSILSVDPGGEVSLILLQKNDAGSIERKVLVAVPS